MRISEAAPTRLRADKSSKINKATGLRNNARKKCQSMFLNSMDMKRRRKRQERNPGTVKTNAASEMKQT